MTRRRALLPLALLTAALLGACAPTRTADRPAVTTLDFRAFDGQETTLRAQGVRVFGRGASASRDFEPEYIAVSPDGRRAWVTLQENNAVAILDLGNAPRVERVVALGFKDHSRSGQGLDPSDRDGANIRPARVLGMYQPDSIAAFSANGRTFLITANEGDAREYGDFKEEARVASLKLDPAAFPDAAALQNNNNLGRLNVTNTLGDRDGDGDFDELYAFGARSFSVLDADARVLHDSGDAIERETLRARPNFFNADHTANVLDDRSDNKGPEPEGVAVGTVGGRTFAFVGLERASGVLSVDLTDPAAPRIVGYLDHRDFAVDPKANLAGAKDLGPEGLLFVPANESPNGAPMLVVSNEVSGTTTLYRVADGGTLTVLGTHAAGAFNQGAAEIPAYDPGTKRLFVVNGATGSIDILDAADPTKPTLVRSVSLAPHGGSANSVAVKNGLVAVAVQNDANRQANGRVVFLAPDGTFRAQVEVGALPDMLTFTPDGTRVLVANEGEPGVDYQTDPEGSVSLVDVAAVLAGK